MTLLAPDQGFAFKEIRPCDDAYPGEGASPGGGGRKPLDDFIRERG